MCNRIYEVGEWATKEKMLTVEDFEVSSRVSGWGMSDRRQSKRERSQL